MKILVAEDDIMLADFLEEALLELGHDVCGVANTVAEAVVLARLHRPDIAVLDMQLGGAELGTQIVDQLAASGDLGDTGILYVTGEVDRVHREARFGHACLNKPYGLTALQSALIIVLDLASDRTTSHALPQGMALLLEAQMTSMRVTQQASPRIAAIQSDRDAMPHDPRLLCGSQQSATHLGNRSTPLADCMAQALVR